MMDAMDVVNNVVMFLDNASGIEIFEAVYGTGHHESYINEKMSFIKNLNRLWGALDTAHRNRLVEVAQAKYSKA